MSKRLQVRATEEQQANRAQLVSLFGESPIPRDELLVNLPLYMRSSTVAKLLYVNELYERIVPIPGVVFEFGVWWGANLALFESLRAVYEPYNYTRKIVGFDTFEGYPSPTDEDGGHELAAAGQYAVTADYVDHLTAVMEYHERENTMGHIRKYELVPGDARETTAAYLQSHPETLIALAYFDMQLYEPTRDALEAIRPHLVRGSVIALDELNSPEFPGETIAFREVMGAANYSIHKSRYLPDRTFVVVD
jgi:hypothetical protein